MTLHHKLLVTLCSCGSPFQKDRWHKHTQGMSAEVKGLHTKEKEVYFCASHKVTVRDREDARAHDSCMYVSLQKPQMHQVLTGKEVSDLASTITKAKNKARMKAEREARKREEALAVASIANEIGLPAQPQAGPSGLNVSRDEESDSSSVSFKSKAPRVRRLTDSSFGDNEDDRPLCHSSPKRMRTVSSQKVESRRVATHPSQTTAVVSITDKLKKAEAARNEAVRQVEMYKAKDEMRKRQEIELRKVKDELASARQAEEEKQKKMKEELDAMREKVKEFEREAQEAKAQKVKAEAEKRALESEMAAKVLEAKRAIRAEYERAKGKPIRWLGHFACVKGKLTREDHWEGLDLDVSSRCYASGCVSCHHLKIETTDPDIKVLLKNAHIIGTIV